MEIQIAKISAVKIALKKMFTQDWFDVCIVKNCAQVLGVFIPMNIEHIMSTIHCVKYSTMDKEFREWLFKETVMLFAKPCKFNLDLLDKIEIKSASEIEAKFKMIEK